LEIMSGEEIAEIEKKLENHEERISRLERAIWEEPKITTKKLSVREFILSKNPKNEMERTLAVGYYLEEYENLTSFNAKDLANGFRKAKEKIPGNINYEVIRNIQKGYMEEAEEKKENRKAWYLTNSGAEYVQSDFKSGESKS